MFPAITEVRYLGILRSMRIERATHEDFLEILHDLADFWSSSGPPNRTLPYHYPFLVHEFADTAFVVREDDTVIAYLFGFVATAEPVGYIHLVGVRAAHQGTGIGRALYEHFAVIARERGCTHVRAVTAPFNTDSGVPRRDGLRGDRALADARGTADLRRLPRSR